MQEARAGHDDDAFADLCCLLVYMFGISHEEVLEMPYLRAEVLTKWYSETFAKGAESSAVPDELNIRTFGRR